MKKDNTKLFQLLDREVDTSIESIEKHFVNHLEYSIGKTKSDIRNEDIYKALGLTLRDFLIDRMNTTLAKYQEIQNKQVYYFSLEFLIGRMLYNCLLNMGLYKTVEKVLDGLGYTLSDVLEFEMDAGLGNGGLGRLAACFLDSLATLNLPGFGYGIRYDYGIFNQIIAKGFQLEMPDHWDADGIPYEVVRPEKKFPVGFFGYVETRVDARGVIVKDWVPAETVLALAHDIPIPGYNTNTVNFLRLWTARSSEEFNLDYFNHGNYMKAVEDKTISENISKVLYPNDTTEQGKLLRLKQQYFMVSASLGDILEKHKKDYGTLDNLPEKVAIQLNDTHPSVAIPELMRILMDSEMYSWEKAWNITKNVFAYTNHTVLPEALETWSVALFQQLLPRHTEIIFEINHRFLNEARNSGKVPESDISKISIFQEGNDKKIRMANLSIIGSSSVNGVAALHTQLLKETIFKPFYEYTPEKFNNKTNGITQRRWLLQCNPALSKLISEVVGEGFSTDLFQLRGLEKVSKDASFQEKWKAIKLANKVALSKIIKSETGIAVDPNSLFDVQIKRFHEYKRQLLNLLRVIGLYTKIKENPKNFVQPRTILFGGKAAPGYYMAKLIIKLINAVAEVVNHDPDVNGRIKVVFMPNYRVSLAEKIIPATELSEQISTAGTEASGTGNMKFALNGALTVGTLDGANVEIGEEVGDDNIFIFGLKAHEVMELKRSGYKPGDFIEKNPDLQKILTLLKGNFFSPDQPGLFLPIHDSLVFKDEYLLMADYQAYFDIQESISKSFQDTKSWTTKSIINVAKIGKFSSDRTILEYSKEVWKISPVEQKTPSTKNQI